MYCSELYFKQARLRSKRAVFSGLGAPSSKPSRFANAFRYHINPHYEVTRRGLKAVDPLAAYYKRTYALIAVR